MKFSIDSALFVRVVKAVSLACSDDFTRPHLNAVRFGFADDAPSLDSFTFVATDGHWLARYDAQTSTRYDSCDVRDVEITHMDGFHAANVNAKNPTAHHPTRHALLALADVAPMLKAIGTKPRGDLAITVDAKSIHVDYPVGRVSVTFANVEASFPPFEQVSPAPWSRTPLADVGAISFSTELLTDVSKAAAIVADSKRAVGLTFDLGSSLDPMRVTSTAARGFSAILMPMRDGHAPERPMMLASEAKSLIRAARADAVAKPATVPSVYTEDAQAAE